MENRRKFLQKLGLGSLAVGMASAPILAQAIDESIKEKVVNIDDLLNKKVWAYYIKQKKSGYFIGPYLHYKDAEMFGFFSNCNVNLRFSNFAFKKINENYNYISNTFDVIEKETTINNIITSILEGQYRGYNYEHSSSINRLKLSIK